MSSSARALLAERRAVANDRIDVPKEHRSFRSMHRREALGLLAAGALTSCGLCAAATRAVAAEAHGAEGGAPHWGYEGEAGPDHWGRLSPDFKVCELGLEQTPINIEAAEHAALDPVVVDFHSMPLHLLNNGHTIQVNCATGAGQTRIAGTRYDLVQFHFHHPSEHLVSGHAFDLECHFVHRSEAGALAVLGVFLRSGATNDALQPIWAAMPGEAGPELATSTIIDPAALLPRERGFFRYMGSLTTPPCSEGLIWTVFREALEASPEQIRQFAALFPNNARPVQRRNRRRLLESL